MNWGYVLTPDFVMVAGLLFGLFGVPWLLARMAP